MQLCDLNHISEVLNLPVSSSLNGDTNSTFLTKLLWELNVSPCNTPRKARGQWETLNIVGYC